MAKLGVPFYWDNEKLSALKVLAKYGRHGKDRIDWSLAKSSRPKERKLLKDRTDSQLSKSWSKYKKVLNGICYMAGCTNRRTTDGVYCEKHRKYNIEVAQHIRERLIIGKALADNEPLVKEIINKKSKKALVDFLVRNIHKIGVVERRSFLGKEYERRAK